MDQEARPWSAVVGLKKRHDVNRVVMVGHSGGVVISEVMLGRAAPLADDSDTGLLPVRHCPVGAFSTIDNHLRTRSLRSTTCRPYRRPRKSTH